MDWSSRNWDLNCSDSNNLSICSHIFLYESLIANLVSLYLLYNLSLLFVLLCNYDITVVWYTAFQFQGALLAFCKLKWKHLGNAAYFEKILRRWTGDVHFLFPHLTTTTNFLAFRNGGSNFFFTKRKRMYNYILIAFIKNLIIAFNFFVPSSTIIFFYDKKTWKSYSKSCCYWICFGLQNNKANTKMAEHLFWRINCTKLRLLLVTFCLFILFIKLLVN